MSSLNSFHQLVFICIVVVMSTTSFEPVSGANNRGSCKEARLCCPGRDASCVVNGKTKSKSIINSMFSKHLNEINEISTSDDGNGDTGSSSAKSCYCDHACTTVGDCCYDYEQTCGVADCQVTDWGIWSECDASCGQGSMSRSRKVLREARNGGKECPEMTQKRGCIGVNCATVDRSAQTFKASREAALILPSSYSSLRMINETQDIRRNLRLRYPKDPAKDLSNEYCVVFEVTKSRKGCEVSENEANRNLYPGAKVCVSCESAAMRKHLGYRCHGHGVDDKQTRWTSVSASNCHGRWIRKGTFAQCPCHDDPIPDFIFV